MLKIEDKMDFQGLNGKKCEILMVINFMVNSTGNPGVNSKTMNILNMGIMFF